MRVFLTCLILFVSCTKELKNDINNLNEIIDSMRVEIDSLNSNLAKFKITESQLNQIINDMEIKVNNFNYMYENEIIGCWFNESFTIGNTPLFIEINIFKGLFKNPILSTYITMNKSNILFVWNISLLAYFQII